ncbi:MAG: MarR family transcriptional regulator [Holosporales bacterium]|jgi:DNA-binding MarR family transcriptional regulator|nr:MarR family transcriptional regulator [Holosporales bacterium]
MKDLYLDMVSSIERTHRLFLEVVKNELDRLGVYDINNVQALVLYYIGKSQLTVSELMSRGYYLGSNVSYNLRKMVQGGYVEQTTSVHDRRATIIKLTARGLDFYKKFDAALNRQVDLLREKGVQEVSLKEAAGPLLQVESLWTELLLRR